MRRPLAVLASLAVIAFLTLSAAVPEPAAGRNPPPGPDPNADAKAKAAESASAFGLALYGQVRGEPGNLFLSPYSIASALAMTWAGARGETAAEMAETLALPEAWRGEPERIHAAFGHLTASLNDPKAAYELTVAGALWGQKGYGFQGEFLGLVGEHYGAGLREVDFRRATEAARTTINAWVEKETREKIQNLIPRGALPPDTRLVLTNAIYFLGTWQFPFGKDDTKEEAFFAPSGTVKVPMMRDAKHYLYADAGGHHVLQLAYKGRDLAMLLLVPKAKDGLAAVEASLSPKALADWIGEMKHTRVRLFLPRFKTTWQCMLAKTLSEMGMARAFDPDKADFSGMNGGKEPLWIGQVVHKAFVEVNEEGTEAAAATAVMMAGSAAPPAPPPVVRCDRPFLYLIRDTRSGAILFLGRLVNPAE
jgi:serpin B